MHYVDIVALPRTHILKELAKYAEDPAERDKLLLMADTSAEGRRDSISEEWSSSVSLSEIIHNESGPSN